MPQVCALDADGWRRILTSNSNSFILYQINSENKSLETFIACRWLVTSNKNPGLRPTGVGEVLRRIAGKMVMNILKKDVMHAAGSLQVCAGQEAGAEAAIRTMCDIYNKEHSEAVLLVDGENAFNKM